MVYTGCFDRYDPGKDEFETYTIAMDRGSRAGYKGKIYHDLIPKKNIYKEWKNNKTEMTNREANEIFVKKYYDEVLKKLSPEKVHRDLDESLILCYEDYYKFSYRHIVAAWLELTLGEDVPEIEMIDGQGYILNKPNYIKAILGNIIDEEMENSSDKPKVYKRV